MFDLEPNEARLLLDIALMAVGQNRFETATKLLAALKAFRPHAESLAVAETVLLLSRGAPDEAIAFVEREQQPDRFPDSAMLQVFKGLALVKTGRLQEAYAALSEAAAGSDPVAAQMASDLLSEKSHA